MSIAMPQPAYASEHPHPQQPRTQYDQDPVAAGTDSSPSQLQPPQEYPYTHAHDPTTLAPSPNSNSNATNSNFASPKPESSNYSAGRDITRTPSPTSSEVDLLNGVRKPKSKKTMIRMALILLVVIVVIVLVEAFHKQIVNALEPVTRWLHGLRAGWLIPIVVLIALSFPPLFGHELVAMLCGLVWGLGEGFGIVAAGTLLGESSTYFVFKYFCARRGRRLELTSLPYGSLAHIIREGAFGGLPIAVMVRYSSFPAHFTTAVLSTCGLPFYTFLAAAVLSLPKQLALVYVGVALSTDSSRSSKIQKIVIAVTVVITVLAMLYIRRRMVQARPAVVYARRKARQQEMVAAVQADSEGAQPGAGRRKKETEGAVV
ncbi:hypothetical protein K438DRAFT_1715711 [Mycena galopus ATCC 62051]|nr:hypothetical protein K438DRAFT_1715711 [Mycena galopus ATCC 62051]